MTGRWFSPGTPVSSTNKTGHHDIAEILLKVALNTINLIQPNLNHNIWGKKNCLCWQNRFQTDVYTENHISLEYTCIPTEKDVSAHKVFYIDCYIQHILAYLYINIMSSVFYLGLQPCR